MKTRIEGAVKQLVSDLLYYDRKNDEELKKGDIENAIIAKKISVEEIVDIFHNELIAKLYFLNQ